MSLRNYIHKLQQKPVHERERIAVIATAVGFAVIFLIWIVSFNEMNKPAEQPVDQTSASLNDLKNNFQTGKDSIQNMMQQLPGQTSTAGTDTSSGTQSLGTDNSVDNSANSPAPAENNNSDQNNKNSVPQLP